MYDYLSFELLFSKNQRRTFCFSLIVDHNVGRTRDAQLTIYIQDSRKRFKLTGSSNLLSVKRLM